MGTIPMALPVRKLSANVQYDAAATKQALWEVAELPQTHTWATRRKLRTLDRLLDRLMDTMGRLISCLSRDTQVEEFSAEAAATIANDIAVGVQLTDALLDGLPEALCENCLRECAEKIERLRDLNDHLDNFAESFRIAQSETCTALLASIAHGVIDRKAVPV